MNWKIARIALLSCIGLAVIFFTNPDNVATIEAFRIVVQEKTKDIEADKNRREHEKFRAEDEKRIKADQERAEAAQKAHEEKMALEKTAATSFTSEKLHALFEGSVWDIKLLRDGSILVGGEHRQTLGLARLNSDLKLDPVFNQKISTLSRYKLSGFVAQIQVDASDRIYLLGQFTLKGEKTPFGHVRRIVEI